MHYSKAKLKKMSIADFFKNFSFANEFLEKFSDENFPYEIKILCDSCFMAKDHTLDFVFKKYKIVEEKFFEMFREFEKRGE